MRLVSLHTNVLGVERFPNNQTKMPDENVVTNINKEDRLQKNIIVCLFHH